MYIKSQLGSCVGCFLGSGRVEKLQSSVVVRRRPGGEDIACYCCKGYWRTSFKVKRTVRSFLKDIKIYREFVSVVT